MFPGTSCPATIGLSLRDENHSTIEAPRIKLALMGFPLGLAGNVTPNSRSDDLIISRRANKILNFRVTHFCPTPMAAHIVVARTTTDFRGMTSQASATR
jgi:hypothetical protein